MPRQRADKTSVWVNLSDRERVVIRLLAATLHRHDAKRFPPHMTEANVIRTALRALALGNLPALDPSLFVIVKTGRPKTVRKSAA